MDMFIYYFVWLCDFISLFYMYTAESYCFPHNVHVDSLLWMANTHLQLSPADGSANQRLFLADTFI